VICLEEEIRINSKDALIVADVQKDFLPDGALPVIGGDEVIPVLNDYINMFKTANARIFAIRDWHPPNHMSFKPFGGSWPMHCLQNTEGAKFPFDLRLPEDVVVFSKAMDPQREAYSGFDGTMLAEDLTKSGVTRIFVGGLTTDYCIRTTVLDGLALGFSVILLLDATRGINVKPEDSEKAIEQMQAKGARIATLKNFADLSEMPVLQPAEEETAEKTLARASVKKKARLRSRGPYRQTKVER